MVSAQESNHDSKTLPGVFGTSPLNRGFEDESLADPTQPAKWQYFQDGLGTTAGLDTTEHHGGKQSLMLETTIAGTANWYESEFFQWGPHQLRTIEVWVQLQTTPLDNVGVYIDFYDETFNLVESQVGTANRTFNTAGFNRYPQRLGPSGGHVRYAKLILRNDAISALSPNKVWFDDVSVSSVTDTEMMADSGVTPNSYGLSTIVVDHAGLITSVTPKTLSDAEHGNRGGGSLHSAATTSTNGFMPATDKLKLDNAVDTATASRLVIRDASGRAKFADPSASSDAATKAYVDAVAQGFFWKEAVRVVSKINVTISNPGTSTFDGVTLSNGDRVLLASQSTASQNGIYIFNGSSSAMTRATDADVSAEVKGGMTMWASEGSTYADTAWTLTTDNPITLGLSNLTFTQTSGLGQITAGAGMTKTGNVIDVIAADSTITVNTDSIQVNTSLIATKTYADTKVASVGGTGAIVSTGGTTPSISITAATGSTPGSMSAADKQKLDDASSGLVASVLVMRDNNSRFSAADPSSGSHVATKTYVDGLIKISDVQEDYASTAVTLGSDPTSDTTVKRNNGSTDMSVTIVLAATKMVYVEFWARIDKSPSASGRTRTCIYDGGSIIMPDVGGRQSNNSVPVVDNEQQVFVRGWVSLAAGTHTLKPKHQATYTTAAISWYERYLMAVVL